MSVEEVLSARNWRLLDSLDSDMANWQIEPCSELSETDEVVYSALGECMTRNGIVVRPLLVVREVGTYEWWGDTCEYVNGAWKQVGLNPERELQNEAPRLLHEFVGAPLENDPSFMIEYSHEKQRAGFVQLRDQFHMQP